ncbi:hypothetical protein GBA52_010049 [Prunus armeniaca]|nr:hypothetical protein GBA52_010049 [Prunus armeniaca]
MTTSSVTWWIVFDFGRKGIGTCLLCLVILHWLDEELKSLGVALDRELSGFPKCVPLFLRVLSS